MDGVMKIYELTKKFPAEEKYSMTDQIRRSSRSVCANMAEAWRKRRYRAAFISKLNDSEAECAETQVWIELAQKCGYWSEGVSGELDMLYENILGKIVRMIDHSDSWLIKVK
jgi:four helix bundle protein